MYYAIAYIGEIRQNIGTICQTFSSGGFDMQHGIYAFKFETAEKLNYFIQHISNISGDSAVCIIFDSINGWADDIPNIIIEPSQIVEPSCIGASNALFGDLIEYGLWVSQYLDTEQVRNLLDPADGTGVVVPVTGRFVAPELEE